jgi:predicted nucleotide-binding protein
MARRTTKTPPGPEIPRSLEPVKAIELLNRQITKAEELLQRGHLSWSDHSPWLNTTRDYLIRAFGSASPNVNAVIYASSDIPSHMGMSEAESEKSRVSLLKNQIKMLRSCIEQLETEIEISSVSSLPSVSASSSESSSDRVFVVHGRDPGIKESVARFLEKLGLEPVILHEKPNEGRTIIEKFSDYSDVHFAVVLLTGDDEGRLRGTEESLRPRARQNVILELGYFLGKLGRARVCAIYDEGVDIPSDYQGVIFVPLQPPERWRSDLVRELKAARFNVDANKIFSAD